MHRMALGRTSSFPSFRNAVTNSFSSMAFIGLPWPRKSTGIFSVFAIWAVILFNSFNFILNFLLHLELNLNSFLVYLIGLLALLLHCSYSYFIGTVPICLLWHKDNLPPGHWHYIFR